jgi:uncharacterized protein (TIGR02266 family)
MTVRYKSATVEEFIEHHSHDVSSGGIFIKTSSPYPPGTLLKFEIRIQDEQTVLSGVGRVVWKREPDAAASDSPAGMGVKFIKIDDKSKSLITRLVAAHGGGPSAYDAGKPADEPAESEGGATADSAKPAGPTKAEIAKRGGTLLGIGAIGAGKPKLDAKAPPEPKKEDAGGFFPSTTPESEQPPPEERTVMRQAAELLKQALAEAGGSLDDVGGPLGKDALAAGDKKTETKDAAKPSDTAKPAATATTTATAAKPADAAKPVEAAKPAETAKPAEMAKAADEIAPAAADDKPKESARSLALVEQQDDEDEDEDEAVEAKEPPKAAAKSPVKVDEKPKAAEVKPAAKTATTKPAVATATAKPFGAQQQEEGGGGRLLTILLVVAAVGGALWLFFGQKEPEAPKPAPATNQTSAVTPPTTPAPPVMTAPTPEMQPTATAAPTGTAGTAPTTTGTAATTAAPTGTAATTAAPTATARPTAAPGDTAAPKATTTPRAPKTTPKPKAPADDPYG